MFCDDSTDDTNNFYSGDTFKLKKKSRLPFIHFINVYSGGHNILKHQSVEVKVGLKAKIKGICKLCVLYQAFYITPICQDNVISHKH